MPSASVDLRSSPTTIDDSGGASELRHLLQVIPCDAPPHGYGGGGDDSAIAIFLRLPRRRFFLAF